jgi:hypothetical protein
MYFAHMYYIYMNELYFFLLKGIVQRILRGVDTTVC